jgi:dTDP-4-dehydrorhamnose 3,5-epimerase
VAHVGKAQQDNSDLDSRLVSSLDGCQLIDNHNFFDERGTFRKILPLEHGITSSHFSVSQINLSHNRIVGTVRGLHYQVEPFAESKLVSCISGSVFDVLLDLRPKSPTYGKFACYRLTPASGSLLISPLVAHGFQTLEEDTVLLYIHTNDYSPADSKGINPLDAELRIPWTLPISKISDSDRDLPSLSEVVV